MAESISFELTEEQKNAMGAGVKRGEGASGDVAYTISFAGGESGGSYGEMQNDVRKNEDARSTFKEILENYADAEGNKLSSNLVEDIINRISALDADGNSINDEQGKPIVLTGDIISSEEKIIIKEALSSDFGKQKVKEQDDNALNIVKNHVEGTINVANTKWESTDASLGGGVLNQNHPDFIRAIELIGAWANRTGNLDTFNRYINGEMITLGNGATLELTGPPTLTDIENYIKNQKQFRPDGNNEPYEKWRDRVRSLDSNEYRVQSGDTLAALSERYGVTEQELQDLNPNIDFNDLKIDDILNIPDQEGGNTGGGGDEGELLKAA